VLVPVDGSESAWSALEYAVEHHPDGELTVLYVVDPMRGDYYGAEEHSSPVRRSEELLAEAQERLAGAPDGLDVETASVTGRPTDAILDYAQTHDMDQIVMGSRGRSGLSRLLLGSVAETVVRRAASPVTIVR